MKLSHGATALAALLLGVSCAVSARTVPQRRDDCVHNDVGTFDLLQPLKLPDGFDHFNDHQYPMDNRDK